MKEFDTGTRDTTKDNDRFSRTMLPVLVESTNSMIAAGYHVDLFLISHYPLSEARLLELKVALPKSVGLQNWEDATPLGYAQDLSTANVREVTRGLARQHRYVIKDKLLEYDIFVNFEDDMLVKGVSVDHFVSVTNDLYRLRRSAPDNVPRLSKRQQSDSFYGEMTKAQLERMLPGFIRVEAAIRGFQPHQDNLYAQIAVDYDWNATHRDLHLDPSFCCHVSDTAANEDLPAAPSRDAIYFWETSIDALGVRKLPERAAWDWVVLQAGNTGRGRSDNDFIGDFWSGRDHDYFKERPDRVKGRYLNNQGGWMATRRQILELHMYRCKGGYLPPLGRRDYPEDGLDKMSVEYWSGGIQLVASWSCNMQRIVTLEPEGFAKQLLYHTSNNKQRAENVRHRYSSRTIDQFWAQLNTVRKNAERRVHQERVA
jgi:hypothetical protein